MEPQYEGYSFGQVVEAEVEAALGAWRATYQPSATIEECLALHIRRLDVQASRLRGGIIQITVEVIAQRKVQDDYYWSRYVPHPVDRDRAYGNI